MKYIIVTTIALMIAGYSVLNPTYFIPGFVCLGIAVLTFPFTFGREMELHR